MVESGTCYQIHKPGSHVSGTISYHLPYEIYRAIGHRGGLLDDEFTQT